MRDSILRPFEERDWPDMVRFYEEFYRPGYIFTQRPFFDWNFTSPLRPDDRSGQRLALDHDKIIGIVGVLAWPLQVAGAETHGQILINLYLDPAYRARPFLGQRLLQSGTFDYRYILTLGYRARILPMLKRMGRVYHWHMRRFVKCLDAGRTTRLLDESPRFARLDAAEQKAVSTRVQESAAVSTPAPTLIVRRQERFDTTWDEAWQEIRQGYGFTTWRHSAFLNWRYIDYPRPLYTCLVVSDGPRPTGLVVLRIETPPIGTIVRIVDLVATDSARHDLLAVTEQVAQEHNAIFIDYIAAGALDETLLAEAGYREFADEQGAMLLPVDFAPIRHRATIHALVTFFDRTDPGCTDFDSGRFYVVKGDGDQDRAN